ncbi:MAG: hypothetical protein L3J16_07150, partial [Anaerolineales bacterium]|nr:hypothetical protein [Anaerolineales bacterium]
METLLQSGLDFVLAFQQMGDWLLKPMEFFTFLGTENFYILLLPVLYWCIDAKLGLQVGVVMLFSTSVYNS